MAVLACTRIGVHCEQLKRRDLEKRLTECGWRFHRSGGRHDVWTDGEREEAVPRHREINERLAQAILRRACREHT
ncbi:MAG TPA: type II toxin-antitoxin system HicA family toxin [Thermoanaerobaculia bacterium]|nr:type II toxin-antitoxin system HicA family toxin [Thermoanaerobaculia bacterium]